MVTMYPKWGTISRSAASGYETVQHLLPARVLEIDFELVAFDCDDGAVAEFFVEDPLAQ